MASGFSSSNAIMGVRKTTDFLEKTTWTLAASMVVLSILAAYSIPSSVEGGGIIMEQAQQEESTNPYNMPIGTSAPDASAPIGNGSDSADSTAE